jgi:putative ABC transport system substrate-binding protein
MLPALSSIPKRERSIQAIVLVFTVYASLALAMLATAARAQPGGTIPRIGVLSSAQSAMWEGFQQGLKDLGHVEGRNVIIEWRWTEGKAGRAPELAVELVRLKPDLIVASGPQPTVAVKEATASIPVVFLGVGDPVGLGLVSSLARPGGNMTGVTAIVPGGFTAKMIALLKEAVPQASRVVILMDPTSASHRQILSTEIPTAAERLHLDFLVIEAQTSQELDGAFERAARSRADGIVVMGGPLTFVHRLRLVDLAAKHRLPAMYFFRDAVQAGGLMVYALNWHDHGRRAAAYVDISKHVGRVKSERVLV